MRSNYPLEVKKFTSVEELYDDLRDRVGVELRKAAATPITKTNRNAQPPPAFSPFVFLYFNFLSHHYQEERTKEEKEEKKSIRTTYIRKIQTIM